MQVHIQVYVWTRGMWMILFFLSLSQRQQKKLQRLLLLLRLRLIVEEDSGLYGGHQPRVKTLSLLV